MPQLHYDIMLFNTLSYFTVEFAFRLPFGALIFANMPFISQFIAFNTITAKTVIQ